MDDDEYMQMIMIMPVPHRCTMDKLLYRHSLMKEYKRNKKEILKFGEDKELSEYRQLMIKKYNDRELTEYRKMIIKKNNDHILVDLEDTDLKLKCEIYTKSLSKIDTN